MINLKNKVCRNQKKYYEREAHDRIAYKYEGVAEHSEKHTYTYYIEQDANAAIQYF
jgi:hypothetical protein